MSPLTSRRAYSGLLGSEPMTIPRGVVLVLYAPVSSPVVTVEGRRGTIWTLDFTGLGKDSIVPVDGSVWGTARLTSGPGTSISYTYFPRDLAPRFRLDTVSPLLAGTLIASISGTADVTVQNAVIDVASSVVSNGGSTPAQQTLSNVNVPTGVSAQSVTYTPAAGTKLRVWGVLGYWKPGSVTAPLTITEVYVNRSKPVTGYSVYASRRWDKSSLSVDGTKDLALLVCEPSVNANYTGATVTELVPMDAGAIYQVGPDETISFAVVFNNTSGFAGSGTLVLLLMGEVVPL